jgi:hypothetical protein
MPAPVSGGVRVIEDEVIFTLRAPEAKTVFLVGDFNNWNPTVEKMVKEGDVFEWSLFLVAGDYRYKFVVDGKWINDPDNPPKDPQRGSPLMLVEVPGGLQIKELDAQGRPIGAVFKPSARYIGRFIYDDEFEADQIVDINMEVEDKSYFSRATLRTTDDSWEFSPVRSDIFFDRGRFETQIWKGQLTAFENDTVWTSSDPFALIGPRGVYRYNAGFGKRGLSLEIPMSGSLGINFIFADKPDRDSFASIIQAAGMRISSLSSTHGDSMTYAYRLGENGSDLWGVEALLRLGNYQAGFISRIDRGLHPGVLNTMQPVDTFYENAAYITDEQWQGTGFWLRAEIIGSLDAKLAYGHGQASLNRRRRSASVSNAPAEIDIGRNAVEWDAVQKIQESQRIAGNVSYQRSSLRCVFGMDYEWFEFKPGIFAASEAKILEARFDAIYRPGAWTGSLHLEYVDQDYGQTPPSFHIYSPERNFWLRGGDRFLPETIVSLDEESFSLLRLTFSNRQHMFVAGDDNDSRRLRLFVEAGMNAGGMMEAFDYGYSRLSIERVLFDRYYAQLDSRGAVYDKTEWGESKAFLSAYIESGYRSDRMEISLGFGFDPVVFDPVRNEYFAIGRGESLRKALGGTFSRGASGDIGMRLLDLEHALETDRSLKLECILLF